MLYSVYHMDNDTNEISEQDKTHIAVCSCCTLATILKHCNECKFNIGLQYKIIVLTSQMNSPKYDQIESYNHFS